MLSTGQINNFTICAVHIDILAPLWKPVWTELALHACWRLPCKNQQQMSVPSRAAGNAGFSEYCRRTLNKSCIPKWKQRSLLSLSPRSIFSHSISVNTTHWKMHNFVSLISRAPVQSPEKSQEMNPKYILTLWTCPSLYYLPRFLVYSFVFLDMLVSTRFAELTSSGAPKVALITVDRAAQLFTRLLITGPGPGSSQDLGRDERYFCGSWNSWESLRLDWFRCGRFFVGWRTAARCCSRCGFGSCTEVWSFVGDAVASSWSRHTLGVSTTM